MTKLRLLAAFMVAVVLGSLLVACGGGGEAEAKIYTYTPDFFLSNVKDTKRYVKAEIVVEMTAEKDVTTMEEKVYILKDAMLGILRSKTEDELSSPDAQSVLSTEITAAIESEMGITSVHRIYFNSLIMQ